MSTKAAAKEWKLCIDEGMLEEGRGETMVAIISVDVYRREDFSKSKRETAHSLSVRNGFWSLRFSLVSTQRLSCSYRRIYLINKFKLQLLLALLLEVKWAEITISSREIAISARDFSRISLRRSGTRIFFGGFEMMISMHSR